MNTQNDYDIFIKRSSIERGFKYPTLEELNKRKIKISKNKNNFKTRLMWDDEFENSKYLEIVNEIYSIQSINNKDKNKDIYDKISCNSVTYI